MKVVSYEHLFGDNEVKLNNPLMGTETVMDLLNALSNL